MSIQELPAESASIAPDTSAGGAGELTAGDAPVMSPQPPTRDVVLKVPVNTPDNVVSLSVNLGIMAHEAISKGMMLILFPTVVKGDQGKPRHAIGRCLVPLSSARDVDRVVSLAEVITKTNLAVVQASGDPINALPARLEGENQKDNAARDLKAKAAGHAGGIITATR